MTENLHEKLVEALKAIKPPRQPQLDAVKWLSQNWEKERIFCLSAPVGTGKSNIAVAIQRVIPKTIIITANNLLVNQYGESFSEMNLLKGRANYSCCLGGNCNEGFIEFKQYCSKCPYVGARDRASFGDPTTANPMSFIQSTRGEILDEYDVIIVDEAHTLGSFIRSVFSLSLSFKDTSWKASDLVNLDSVVRWLGYQKGLIKDLINAKKRLNPHEKSRKEEAIIRSIESVTWGIMMSNHSDWFYYTKKDSRGVNHLHVESINPPKKIMEYFLSAKKLILMSGTLFPTFIKEIVGDMPYAYLSLPSIIPKGNRRIFLKPAATVVNKDTAPNRFASVIKEITYNYPGKQGIIHTTYEMGQKLYLELAEHMDVRFNTKETKKETLDAFKNKEFRWLIAAGMSEGIDLNGDLGEVNIICKLHYPYLGDPYVTKRKAKSDGNLWYASCALLHLLQAAGRTTRGPTDSSVTFLLDPGIIRVLDTIKRLAGNKREQYIPHYFEEAFHT